MGTVGSTEMSALTSQITQNKNLKTVILKVTAKVKSHKL